MPLNEYSQAETNALIVSWTNALIVNIIFRAPSDAPQLDEQPGAMPPDLQARP